VVVAGLVGAKFSERLDLWRFAICWWGALLALDGAVRLRHGTSPLPRLRDWVACAAASVVFWDLFELLNLRLHDWWYAGLPRSPLAGAAFGALCFATVLPAVRLGAALLSPRIEAGIAPARPAARQAPLLLALGLTALALALAFPRAAFPLAWVFLWPLCEAWLARRGDDAPRLLSPLQAWRAGERRVVARLLWLALPLGLLWEGLNWRCARGWVYTVPHFEWWKLFEMPLPGYLGYLPFLLECGAALAILDRLRPGVAAGAMALAGVAALHLLADGTGRKHAAISVAPRMSDAHLLEPGDRDWLAREGLETPREVLRAGRPVPAHVRALAEVAEVAHLGIPWAERLAAAGIRGRAMLASADPQILWNRLAAQGEPPPEPALVRLWVRAARDSR